MIAILFYAISNTMPVAFQNLSIYKQGITHLKSCQIPTKQL